MATRVHCQDLYGVIRLPREEPPEVSRKVWVSNGCAASIRDPERLPDLHVEAK